jgi:autotransporter-associated beta strand protein
MSHSSSASRRFPCPFLAACFFVASLASLPAAVKTWDGGAGTTNWADANNWNPNGLPTSSDAVWLDNSGTNPLPQINTLAGADAATLAVDGIVSGNFLYYGNATPLLLDLWGASVNASNTGPLIYIGTNAEAAVSANKVNFRFQTSGELFVAAGKTLTFNNCILSQGGTRALTKSGAGTVNFAGSGSDVQFTGGFVITEGIWNAGTDTLDLPRAGLITFSNAPGVAATITSGNSHSIAGLAGGNSSSELYATGAGGLTITGGSNTTFSGRIRGATKLTYAGGGTLTLNGNNTYTGATVISNGTLALGASGSIAGSASVAISSGATFRVSALAAGFTLGGGKTISGNGTVAGRLIVASNAVVSPGFGGAGTLMVTNGFTLAAGAHLDLDFASAANYDAVVVTGGNVSLAGDFAGSTLGYTPSIGETFFIVRNTGAGTTTGTLNGVGDGGKVDIGGKWFRLSFTSDFGGSGFAVGGSGNDVALQRIDDPTPSGLAVSIVGATGTAVLQLQFSWLDNAANETGYRVYRVLADGSLELVATLPAGATTFSETGANYTTHTYAVQAFNGAGTIGDLVYATPFVAGGTLAERHEAMLDWVATTVPNLGQFGGGPHRIGRTGFFHGGARIMRGQTATGLSYITTAIEDASAENSNAGFSMWPGMDAWFRWNSLFPQSLKDRYQEVYTTSDLYDNGATPNQRFMICAASYLANSVWGSAVNSVSSAIYDGFTDPSGKGYLVKEIERVPFRGFSEHDANVYLLVTLSPLETLAQFAPDADVRNKSRMVLDWGFANAAGHWLNGHWGVSSTRGSTSGYQDSLGSSKLWWLRFGGPLPDMTDSHPAMPFLAPEFPGILPEVETASRERENSYLRRSFATRNVSVIQAAYFKQSWMTPRYTLWSQVEGRVTFNSDNSINLVDVNPAYIQDGYQGERWALAWDSPPGNDAKLKITTPTTYSGTTSGISIWEDTLQHEDTMIAVYNMPVGGGGNTGNDGNWANEWLTGHIPGGWQAITDEAATTGRIFIHYDSVLIAVYLDRTFAWATNFTVNGVNKAALAIETAPVSEFPQATAAARLAAFRTAVLANAPDISGITNAAPRFIYTNRHGDALDLTFGLAGKINGVTVDYQSWPVLEDPWMYQSQNGPLHLFGRDRTVVANYYDWAQSTNWRPAALNLPSLAVSNAVVDVNLAARVSDAETPGTNFAFTVGGATNGAVTLLADGHTARFTAASNFTGVASFNFTARDRGLHPQLVWHYDFEPPATLVSNKVLDAAGTRRDATLSLVGTGTGAFETNTPAALGANSTRSLRLNESGTNAARLTRLVTPANLSLTNGSWTFATWFKRATRTNDDFIFYVGSGDGFGGGVDELQLYVPANADTLRLLHYTAANSNDVNLISAAAAPTNQWHHAAVTFEKSADSTGTVRLYLNGALAGTVSNVTWALRQDLPVILGGHASTNASLSSRYFNGWLDDAALFRGALSSNEITSLAAQSIATFGGTSVTGSVALAVTAPPPPVPVTLIAAGAIWKYFDQTNDLGTAWRGVAFNDAIWSTGPAMLGFGDANGLLPATTVASNRQWTTYFRRAFHVPDASEVFSLGARLMRDDAAVIYLNGTEVWRDTNMPSGVITNQTPARVGLGGLAESTWLTNTLDPALLVTGTNLLAIEVHQNALTSSDLAMNFELTGTAGVSTNAALGVARDGSELVFVWPAAEAYFTLHSATNLMPPVSWTPVAVEPALSNNFWRLTLPFGTNGQRFFRLQTP